MNCRQIRENDIVERYLNRQLTEAERDAFELHYLECAECFELLKTYEGLREALAGEAAGVGATAGTSSWWNHALLGAAAAVLLIALGLWLYGAGLDGPPSGPGPSLVFLAHFEPPSYKPPTLRGTLDAAGRQFQTAMTAYNNGDYSSALGGLEKASRLDASSPGTSFFLGICYLLQNQTDAGVEALRQTTQLGDSPYLEEAHFYLAKGYLQQRDVDAAIPELEKVIALNGALQTEAQALLEALQRL